MTRRVVVVGGGIAGLAAAHAVSQGGARGAGPVDVVVLERAEAVGGKARTVREGGWLLEAGPTGFLDNEPAMDELVHAAGLEKLRADEAAARRYLVRGGRVREIHANPLKFLASGILSPLGAARLALEPFFPRRRTTEVDESVWEFAARRLGPQAADRLIAPMVLGVFAGDARRTSLAAAFPRMAELEARHGSLVKAMFALKRERGRTAGGPAGPSGKLTSFAEGIERLPRGLADSLLRSGRANVRTGAAVDSLAYSHGPAGDTEGDWRLRVDGEALRARAVVLATESFAAATLLRECEPSIARELAGIATPHVAVVGLGYGPDTSAAMPRGFGALIERGQGIRTLGVLFDTQLFPGRGPEGHLLLRCMVGGATDEAASQLTDEDLAELCRAEVARIFGLAGAVARPEFTRVVRWPRAIPQYDLGHLARIRRVHQRLAESNARHPGLVLAGNYLDGVAFNKAAVSGLAAGRKALRLAEAS